MSSPRGVGGSVREGTRVVLKEITATLHNSTPNHPLGRKNNSNDSLVSREHEVKVRFAREFADIGSIARSATESLSSASSFHSLNSTVSTKSSSGICPDSAPYTPDDIADTSYVNSNIPGVEDLILGCADIHLGNEDSFENAFNSQDFSQDQTFASATDESPFHTSDCSLNEDLKPDYNTVINDEPQVIEANSNTTCDSNQTCISVGAINNTQLVVADGLSAEKENLPYIEESIERSALSQESDNTANKPETFSLASDTLPTSDTDGNKPDATNAVISNSLFSDPIAVNEKQIVESNCSVEALSLTNAHLRRTEVSISSVSNTPIAQSTENSPLPSTSSLENTDSKAKKNSHQDLPESIDNSSLTAFSSPDYTDQKSLASPSASVISPVIQTEESEFIKEQNLPQVLDDHIVPDKKEENSTQLLSKTNIIESEFQEYSQTSIDTPEIKNSRVLNETQNFSPKKDIAIRNETHVVEQQHNLSEAVTVKKKENTVRGVAWTDAVKERDISAEEDFDRTLTLQEVDLDFTSDEDQYTEFKPQRQSTALPLIKEQPDFEELRSSAQEVTNELLNPSPELAEETEQFVTATSEIFKDPSTFDFLLARSNSGHTNRLRTQSLYVKFDPLISNISMLPQGNTQPMNEEQNGKNESPLPNVGTPKRNPAIAAIDRLLFYSPLPGGTVQKLEEAQEKDEQPVEESKSDAPLITDIDMTKELELVRATVLQLEEELEKQKKEHEMELERQKIAFQEKMNKLQAQMAHEVKTKTQMTVVVEEYEKSISRLLTERERDRTNFEQEKVKLQEELQAANHHLTNTEAAFNDVHQKYERLKGVVCVYKNNETVLKESIQENVDTIKTLETRYDQLKDHAMVQLEKANQELDGIRKQNEAETVKLHAMIRKAELKSNSLAELVEQKTKENKELAKILDEVIARVGHENKK